MEDLVSATIAERHVDPALIPDLRVAARTGAQAAINSFLAGFESAGGRRAVRLDPSLESAKFSPESVWRAAMLDRYPAGSWKHSILERVPYRTFAPAEIYNEFRDELIMIHPGHNNIENGTTNTIASLVRDGVLVKSASGRYKPEILESGLIENNRHAYESRDRPLLMTPPRLLDAAAKSVASLLQSRIMQTAWRFETVHTQAIESTSGLYHTLVRVEASRSGDGPAGRYRLTADVALEIDSNNARPTSVRGDCVVIRIFKEGCPEIIAAESCNMRVRHRTNESNPDYELVIAELRTTIDVAQAKLIKRFVDR